MKEREYLFKLGTCVECEVPTGHTTTQNTVGDKDAEWRTVSSENIENG